MENINERINQLKESLDSVKKELDYLDKRAEKDEFCCGTPLLQMIHNHKVMRLKFLMDIEEDFVIPSKIMQRAGASSKDNSFIGGGCFQKEI